MKYSIFLDDVETETFYGDETEGIRKYDEAKEEYLGAEIYDTVELIEYKTIKKDDL